MLRCHLGILGTQKRLEMIRSFHEKKEYLENQQAKAYSVAVRDSGLTKNWNKDLEAKIGGYGPILDCYYKRYEGATPYSSTSNEDLLKFARHMVVHLKDGFRKVRLLLFSHHCVYNTPSVPMKMGRLLSIREIF